jgi:hypothetical protein
VNQIFVIVTTSLLLAASYGFPVRAEACASTSVYLAADSEGTKPAVAYAALEGSSLPFYIARMGHECNATTAEVTYSTRPDATTSPDASSNDYTTVSETRSIGAPPAHGGATVISDGVPLLQDTTEEKLEAFRIHIDSAEGASIGLREAPAFVIDNDGDARFAFVPGAVSQSESHPSASVSVVRLGPAEGDTTVEYAIQPGTALAGSDYTTSSSTGTLSFSGTTRIKNISFTIVNDKESEDDEQLSIKLSGGKTEVGGATKTFTILDNEEKTSPESRFHHPKKGVLYDYNDFRLREVHVFASDDALSSGESGVDRSQIALRRKMESGACKWWDGDGFVSGSCALKEWVEMKAYDPEFYFYKLPALRPTVGTSIENYTGYSRAIDAAGNVESSFETGRNANTFKIDRKKD